MKVFTDYYSPIQYAVDNFEGDTALEFGVATGKTLGIIAEKVHDTTGFDSFEGLPEDWRPGFPKGMFAQAPPQVHGAGLVVGWFEDTLPLWVPSNEYRLQRAKLIHIDCDLYTSTKTILDHLGKFIYPGDMIVFDEYHGYEGFEDGEYKAWLEFAESNSLWYDTLAIGPEQAVFYIR